MSKFLLIIRTLIVVQLLCFTIQDCWSNSTNARPSLMLNTIERTETKFYCGNGAIDLEPEEVETLLNIQCVTYTNVSNQETVENPFQPVFGTNSKINAEVIDENGDIILVVHYSIMYSQGREDIEEYFEKNFFVSVPFQYIGLTGLTDTQKQGYEKSDVNVEVINFSFISIEFENASSAVGLAQELEDASSDIELFASDDVTIYVTDNDLFCTSDPDDRRLDEVIEAFEDPPGLVYWFHLSHDGEDSEGKMYVNSSVDGGGMTSFTGGTQHYYDYHVNDFTASEFIERGFETLSDFIAFNTLDQLSGTVIVENRGEDDLADNDEEIHQFQYECPSIVDPQDNTTNYLAPSGVVVSLPNNSSSNYHAPRFTNQFQKHGFFEGALIGFTVKEGHRKGSWQGRGRGGEFYYYSRRGFMPTPETKLVLPSQPEGAFSVATAKYNPGELESGCLGRTFVVSIFPGFVSSVSLDDSGFGGGPYVNDLFEAGSFTGGIVYSTAQFTIPLCVSSIEFEAFERVAAIFWNPVIRPELPEGQIGWQLDVYNENNKLERIYATYEDFDPTQSPRSPVYYRFICGTGDWEAFDPPTIETLDIYCALLFALSDPALVHPVLDIVGMVPGLGEPADLLNGLIYSIEGDALNAGMSYGAVIPLAGIVSTAGRLKAKVKGLEQVLPSIDEFWIVFKKVQNIGAPVIKRVDANKLLESPAFQALNKTEGNELVEFLLKRPDAGTVEEISRWEDLIVRFLENPAPNAYSVDEMVGAWKAINSASEFKGVAKNIDWIENSAKLKRQGASTVAVDGDLVLKNDATDKVFGRFSKNSEDFGSSGNGTDPPYLEFGDDDFLDLDLNSNDIEWIDDAGGFIVRRSDDGEDVLGGIVKLTDGSFGFVQEIPIDIPQEIATLVKQRGKLNKGYNGNILRTEEAHHVFPIALLKRNLPYLEKAIEGGFDYNDVIANGMKLEKYRKATGKGSHASHPRYTKQIEEKLMDLWDELDDVDSLTPQQAKAQVEMLVTQLRSKINNTISGNGVDKRINLIENIFD